MRFRLPVSTWCRWSRAHEVFLATSGRAPPAVMPSGSDSTPDQKELPHGSLFAGAWSEIEATWGK